MDIKEKLKEKPYWDTSEIEYYEKGYKKLLGSPGRVLQGREVTALSSYPLYILKDLLDTQFKDLELVEKIKYAYLKKIIDNSEVISQFQDVIIINENIVEDLENKFNNLKVLLETRHNEELDLNNNKIYINNKNTDIENYLSNFSVTYKNELKEELNKTTSSVSTLNNYISLLLSDPIELDSLFTDNNKLTTGIETVNIAVIKSDLLRKKLEKIIKVDNNKNKQIEFINKWNIYKTSLENILLLLANDYNNINNNISDVETKLSLAKNAVINNVLDTPIDTLPEVIELDQAVLIFNNALDAYSNIVIENTEKVNSFKSEIDELFSVIID